MSDTLVKLIHEQKLISIVRGIYGSDFSKLAEALYKGGIRLIEVTFDQAHPEDIAKTCAAIEYIHKTYKQDMAVGAGTVTSCEMVDLAKEAGATFILSPDMNPEVIRHTKQLGLVSIPGAMTPSEIQQAHLAGADLVKLFPAGDLGLSYLKSVTAPLNHVPLLAVGGINEDNLESYLKAGVIGAGLGSGLANRKLIEAGNFEAIKRIAENYVEIVKRFSELQS